MIERNGLVLSKEICYWKNYGTDPYTTDYIVWIWIRILSEKYNGKIDISVKAKALFNSKLYICMVFPNISQSRKHDNCFCSFYFNVIMCQNTAHFIFF